MEDNTTESKGDTRMQYKEASCEECHEQTKGKNKDKDKDKDKDKYKYKV